MILPRYDRLGQLDEHREARTVIDFTATQSRIFGNRLSTYAAIRMPPRTMIASRATSAPVGISAMPIELSSFSTTYCTIYCMIVFHLGGEH